MAEEEKARIEEEERQASEEAKRKEEEKAKRKLKEKEKIEQLKKEGKFLTKAQKEEKARNERKLQQMIAAGIKVGGLEEGESEQPKKKPEAKKRPAGRRQEKVSLIKLRVPEREQYRRKGRCVCGLCLLCYLDRRGEGSRRGCRAGSAAGRSCC